MFADTLESTWAERSRRGWTTLTSIGLQALAAGLLILIPIFHPQGLPLLRRLATPVSLGQPQAEPPAQASFTNSTGAISQVSPILASPPRFRYSTTPLTDDGPPPGIGTEGQKTSGAVGSGNLDGVPFSVGEGVQPRMASSSVTTRPIRISQMSEGSLIHRVQPQYPPLARTAGIQGEVVLQAMISKEGTIENLHVVSGHPMLVRAAIEAVSQWRYQPYVLNNERVEVETQITVNFWLNRN